MARKSKDDKAQDDKREKLQKKRFGLYGKQARDDKYDAFYKMPIEFKTKPPRKGCTTKRRYVNDPFAECVLIVTNYIDTKSIDDTDWIVFPPALEEWRSEQERKLTFDNGTIPCFNEISLIEEALGVRSEELASIIEKIRNQVHRNDPAIPNTFFNTDGEYTSIQRRKTKVKHSQWVFRVSPLYGSVDKAKFLRDKINLYLKWRADATKN